jgi:DNA-binding XRE family transcriptional regulator
MVAYMGHIMRSTVADTLPAKARRSLEKLGRDIALARKKRSLTVIMMAERLGVAKSTYLRVEKGDPNAGIGIYAMALFVLGASDKLGDLLDPGGDDIGLLLDERRIPQRVRTRKIPSSL